MQIWLKANCSNFDVDFLYLLFKDRMTISSVQYALRKIDYNFFHSVQSLKFFRPKLFWLFLLKIISYVSVVSHYFTMSTNDVISLH